MPAPKNIAPDTLSTPKGVLICIPRNLIPALRGAVWALQYNYAWARGVGDVDAAKRAFIDALGDIDMSCCEVLADCIDGALGDNPDDGQRALLDALNRLLQQSGNSSAGSGDTSGIADLPPVLPSPSGTCDYDVLFGQVTGMVDLVNGTIVDMLENLEAEAQTFARVSLLISAIPGIGELTQFDELFALAESLITSFKLNYDAAYSSALRDEYRCDLHCVAINAECGLTWESVCQYFADRAVADIFNIDVQDIVEFLLNGTFSGVEYVHALSWFVSMMWATGSSVFGVTPDRVSRVVRAMGNDPDPDWAILCDECETEFCHTWDLTLDPGAWSGFAQYTAAWTVGTGWVGTRASDPDQTYITINLPRALRLTEIEFESSTVVAPGADNYVIDDQYGSIALPRLLWITSVPTQSPVAWSGDDVISALSLGVERTSPNIGGTAITRVTIRGFYTGAHPFGGDNCV